MHRLLVQIRRLTALCGAFLFRIKVLGALLNLAQYLFSRQAVLSGPSFLQIEPTNNCNLSCLLCPAGNKKMLRPEGLMEPADFKKIIDSAAGSLAFIVFYNLGEPFLHDGIFEMADYAASKKIFVKISTNGLFKNEAVIEKIIRSGIDELLVTIDFADASSYAGFKGQDAFYPVKENIRKMVKMRRNNLRPFIKLQLLMLRGNEKRIGDFKSLCREVAADGFQVKKVRVNDYKGETHFEFLSENSRFVRVFYLTDKKTTRACLRPWLSATIFWDGTVVPCCFDMDGDYRLGNVRDLPLAEIWRGRKFRDFRAPRLNGSGGRFICSECSFAFSSGNFVRV